MSERRSKPDSIADALGVERSAHPPYELLEQFVDGTADDVTREIIESHREVCLDCDAELRDLLSFSGRAPASPWLRWVGAAVAAIAVVVAGAYFLRRPVVKKPVMRDLPARATVVSGYGREDWNAAVATALARGSIDRPPILDELRPPPDTLRTPNGGSETAVAMNPAGKVIEETTPLLTWRAARGRFVVSIYDGFERVARSGVLQSPEWRVSPPLSRGRTYTWQVEVRRGGFAELLPSPPAPAALFHVLDETNAAGLAEARRRFPNDHLLLGVLYARAGMQEAAIEELQQHAARSSKSHDVLKSIKRW